MGQGAGLSGSEAGAYQAGGGTCSVGADVGLVDNAGLPLFFAGGVVDKAQAHLVQLFWVQGLCRTQWRNQLVLAKLNLM